MKILILSFYFQPDLCAGSFRCTALVNHLKKLANKDCEIEVITTIPNRYASFNIQAPEIEQSDKVIIRRITLPSHKGGMLDQARAFVHYSRQVNKLTKNKDYDLVFATSSRLMTAVLGAQISNRKKAKLYLDIRDIFVDLIKDIFPGKIAFFVKPIFSILEKWSFSKANRINIVSGGFQDYFNVRYSHTELRWFTNGIDPEFIPLTKIFEQPNEKRESLTVLYAGNIGDGQGLHFIIPKLAKRFEGRVNFRIIGDGGKKNQLKMFIRESGCSNVKLLNPVDRVKLLEEYKNADILFLHLNNYDSLHKVLPSKLFEYAATGKPIWAGVCGFSAKFIQSEIVNAVVFHPCDELEAEAVFEKLQLNLVSRIDFIKKYSRDNIMQAMAKDILSLV
ncbi:glycosyltransferase family 4 protein [Legionella israelensis]|uniref:glycosyltransferase family 4 protein n=1 Tax=Legionella israelensis TaxID=454 RepID=UPI00118166C0|nr:glycosyltransferase family 4 protein [Legionella israelensis]QDP72372.1 glycosyltransferase family 4 protein [Legionella israelensis]